MTPVTLPRLLVASAKIDGGALRSTLEPFSRAVAVEGSLARVLAAMQSGKFDLLVVDESFPQADAALLSFLAARNKNAPQVVFARDRSITELRQLAERASSGLDPADATTIGTDRAPELVDGSLTWKLRPNALSAVSIAAVVLAPVKLFELFPLSETRSLDLALQEAIANGIEHGNLELPSAWRDEYDDRGSDRFSREKERRLISKPYCDRELTISLKILDHEVEISVTDEGNGFSVPQGMPIPASELALHGRGLSIIAAAVDRVRFEQAGRQVVLVKRRAQS